MEEGLVTYICNVSLDPVKIDLMRKFTETVKILEYCNFGGIELTVTKSYLTATFR